MEVVIQVGGVDALSSGLASIMNTHTAIAIQGLTAGIMSWFSSAIGVVWPTLVPTVGDIAKNVGVPANGLISIMSKQQSADAGFASWGTGNSESLVQMIVALCELGIPLDDSRFVKNGKTMQLSRFWN